MSFITYEAEGWNNFLDYSFLHQIKKQVEEKQTTPLPDIVRRLGEPRLKEFITQNPSSVIALYKISERAYELKLLEDALIKKMLEVMRKSGIMSPDKFSLNLTLVSREKEPFEVDRAIFIRFSPFFQIALEAPMREAQENKISFPEDSTKSLKTLVQYVYQGTLPQLTLDEALETYKLAHRLSHEDFQKECEGRIRDAIPKTLLSEDLTLSFLHLVDTYPLVEKPTLKKLWVKKLLDPFSEEVQETANGFLSIPLSLIKHLRYKGPIGALFADLLREIRLPLKDDWNQYTAFLFLIPEENRLHGSSLISGIRYSNEAIELHDPLPLTEIFQTFSHLHKIDLSYVRLQMEDFSFFPSLTSLHTLRMQDCSLNTAKLANLLLYLQDNPLEELDVRDNSSITDFLYEGELFPSLQTLNLSRCSLDKAEWPGLSQFPSLQCIEVQAAKITSTSFTHLARQSASLPLREINASNNSELKQITVHPRELPHLRKLNVRGSGEYRDITLPNNSSSTRINAPYIRHMEVLFSTCEVLL